MYNNDTWNEVSNYRYSNFEEAREYAVSRLPITSVAQRTYNELLTEKAREAVPFPDYCAMIARVMHVIGYYNGDETPYDNLSASAIAENVTMWANNKADKILAMKACDAYNANEPYKLIIQANYERTKDENAIRFFADRYNEFLCNVINKLHSPKISEEDVNTYEGIKKQFSSYLSQSYITDEEKANYGKWLTSANKVNPHVGQKTSRFIRNLIVTVNGSLAEPTSKMMVDIDYTSETVGNGNLVYIADATVYKAGYFYGGKSISISQHEPFTNMEDAEIERKILNAYWEKGFAEYADAINPVVFTRPTVLSLDYVDYILMSHGSGWESCHWICKEDATAGGCNSGGTWSYANDKVSYIMYTTSEDTTESYELAEKITREVVIFDEEKHELICDRLYPQSNDTGCSSVYTEHRLYAQKMIAMIYGYANYWSVFQFCGTNGDYGESDFGEGLPSCPKVETGAYSCAYPDYRYFKSSINIPKEILTAYHDGPAREMVDIGTNSRKLIIRYMDDKGTITVGNKAICPICGNNIASTGSSHFICDNCADDKRYCADCGYAYDEDDLYYCVDTEDYRCSECSAYDEYAGEYYSTADSEWVTVWNCNRGTTEITEESLDRARDNGDVFYCEECERYFWTTKFDPYTGVEETCDEDGYSYCEDCAEDVMATCNECGCIVNKRNAMLIDDEWYCEDCADAKLKSAKEESGEEYMRCSICGNWTGASRTHIVYKHYGFVEGDEPVQVRVCNDCYKTTVHKCAGCGKEFLSSSMVTSAYVANIRRYFCSNDCVDTFARNYIAGKLLPWMRTHIDLEGNENRDEMDVIGQVYNEAPDIVRRPFSKPSDFTDYCKRVIAEGN